MCYNAPCSSILGIEKIMSFSMKLRKVLYNLFFWAILAYSMWLILFKLATDFTTIKIIWAGPIAGMAALLFAALKIHDVLFVKNENIKLKEMETSLKKGFFNIQKKEFFLTLLSLAVLFPFIYKFVNLQVAICFLVGTITIFVSSFFSSLVSMNSNINVLFAAENSAASYHKAAVNGAFSTFLIPAGFSLILFPVLYFIFKDPAIIMGYTFGACLEAFLITCSGEIFAKASNLIFSEKNEAKEAVILANGISSKNMALDFIVTIIAILTGTIINGVLVLNLIGAFIPMTLVAIGVFCAILASIFTKLKGVMNSKLPLFIGFIASVILYSAISYYLIEKVFMPGYGLFYPVMTGVILALFLAGLGYFNLRNKKDELEGFTKEETTARSFVAVSLPLLIAGFMALAAFINAGGMESYTAGFWGLGLAAISMLSVSYIFGALYAALNISKNALIISEADEHKEKIEEFYPAASMYGGKTKTMFSIASIYACFVVFAGFVMTINLEEVDCLNPFVLFALIFGAGVPVLCAGLINGSFIKAAKAIFKKETNDGLEIVKKLSNKGFIGSILPLASVLILPLFSYFGITKLFEKALGMQTLTGTLLGAIVAGGLVAILFGFKDSLSDTKFDFASKECSSPVSNLAIKLIILSLLLTFILFMPTV